MHIIKHSVVTDMQFPDRQFLVPGRSQPDERLSIAGLHARGMQKLRTDVVKHSTAIVRTKRRQIVDDTRGVFDRLHGRFRGFRGKACTAEHVYVNQWPGPSLSRRVVD